MKFLLTSAGIKDASITNVLALKVIDGVVEVISEGHWKLFNPQ